MAKKKKLTRKELLKEPDEFITFSGKLIRFIATHRLKLAGTLAAVILVAGIISGVRFFAHKSENKAFALLSASLAKYSAVLPDKGSAEVYREVEQDFQSILDKYAHRSGGKLARIIFANICYNGGEFDRAVDLYNQALKDFDDHPAVKNLILSGLAYAYEAKKDSHSARRYFDMIAQGEEALYKDDAIFNLGRLHILLGDKEKGKEFYQKIVSDHSDSLYIELAKEYIRQGT